MLADTGIDWTQVIVSVVAGLPAIVAVILSYRIHRQIRTPSGNRIGALVESTYELAEVNTVMTKDIHTSVRNGDGDHKQEA